MNEKTVLFIVNSKDLLKSTIEILYGHQYKILTADTAESALKVLEKNEIPVIVCDEDLPDMSCTTLLMQIKNLYPNTVQILTSQFANSGFLQEAINKGEIYKFLPKPWNELDLIHYLQKALTIYQDRENKDKKSQVLDSALELIAITNNDNKIESINYSFEICMGYTKDDVIHKNIWELLFSEDDRKYYYDIVMQEILLSKTWEGKILVTLKNKKKSHFLLSISEIPNKKTGTTYRAYSFIDLSELKQREQFLTDCINDQSTSTLLNRQSFQKKLFEILNNAKSGSKIYMINLYFDDQYFLDSQFVEDKKYLIFNSIETTLKEKLKELLIIGKLSSNTIGIALKASQVEIIEYLKKINNIFNYPFIVGYKPIYLTPYLGVSVFPNDSSEPNTLINESILAAEYGFINKNRKVIYSENFKQIKQNSHLLYFEIAKNLQSQGFKIYYQPIMAAKTKEIYGFQTFIHIPNKDEGSVIDDYAFLNKIDDFELMDEVHKQLINESFNQLHYWQERYNIPFKITIALAPDYLINSNLVEHLFKVFRQIDIGSDNVIFSISEKNWPVNLRRMKIIMKDLIEMGIKFELNDFGCGYASLPNLTLLPFNRIKLDLAYLKNNFSIAKGYKILHSINTLCKSMGLDSTAKSIEDKNILIFSEDIECDYLQGGFLSAPLDSNRIRSLLDFKFNKE